MIYPSSLGALKEVESLTRRGKIHLIEAIKSVVISFSTNLTMSPADNKMDSTTIATILITLDRMILLSTNDRLVMLGELVVSRSIVFACSSNCMPLKELFFCLCE